MCEGYVPEIEDNPMPYTSGPVDNQYCYNWSVGLDPPSRGGPPLRPGAAPRLEVRGAAHAHLPDGGAPPHPGSDLPPRLGDDPEAARRLSEGGPARPLSGGGPARPLSGGPARRSEGAEASVLGGIGVPVAPPAGGSPAAL